MTTFWSAWITILTLTNIALVAWVLFTNTKSEKGPGVSTGHVVDGIEELDNTPPKWWFLMFCGTIIFALGYLAAYPGLGNWKGFLSWSSASQWQKEVDQANAELGPMYAKFAQTAIPELAKDEKAMRIAGRLFADNCAVCHGSDAQGQYGFPNLTDNDWLYGGEPEKLVETITKGRQGAMPAWGDQLGDEGVENAAHYVLSLSGRAEADAAKAAKGEQTFKTLCVACHGADGKGNQMMGAPNLTDETWLYGGSLAKVKQTILVGRNGRMPAHEELLQPEKIHLLAAYVYSLSHNQGGN